MKLDLVKNSLRLQMVAPLVGAWIEICRILLFSTVCPVAPLVGAWIEITAAGVTIILVDVAPLVGAWIEISSVYKQELAKCRSLLL